MILKEMRKIKTRSKQKIERKTRYKISFKNWKMMMKEMKNQTLMTMTKMEQIM